MIKLKLQPLSEACDECPFYKLNTKNKHVCAFKQMATPVVAMSLMDTSDHYDTDLWNQDCKGNYSQCSFLPLFYDMSSGSTSEEAEEEQEPTEDASVIYEEDVDDEPLPKTIIAVKRVDNPFLIKGDVFIYPTNTQLDIDSINLNRMSNFNLQRECNMIAEKTKIKMGEVYVTGNGGKPNQPSRVACKRIYHAVVAGPSKLVNDSDIQLSTMKALQMADGQGAKIVIIYPSDCGTYDIEQTAVSQLSTIRTFLNVNQETGIRYIFIVMEDEESEAVFSKYYKRIFR